MATRGRRIGVSSGCGRVGALWIDPGQLAALLADEEDFESDDDFELDDSDLADGEDDPESDFDDDDSDFPAAPSDFGAVESDFEPDSELAGTVEDLAPSRESLR